MESKDKIMLQCIREVKCEQVLTTGNWYKDCNVLCEPKWEYLSGLAGSKSKHQIIFRRIVSREGRIWIFFQFWYGEPSVKIQCEEKQKVFILVFL